MNATPSDSDSNAILDRLLSGAGLHRDAQLASLHGVSPQAVSQARRKRKIPEGWVVRVAQQCNLSMDWLMFGKEEAGPPSTSAPQAPSTPAGAPLPDLDLLCIPLVAASLSAGSGSLQTEGEVLDYFAFRSEWLCRKGNPDRMVLMKVYGDSMEPELHDGDTILFRKNPDYHPFNCHIVDGAIYAISIEGDDRVKRLSKIKGGIRVSSDNPRYGDEDFIGQECDDKLRIFGRVIEVSRTF